MRVHIEQNIPLYMFSLSKAMKMKIEKVQKVSVYIILGNDAHIDYICNLAILDMEPLEERREKIALKFASKVLKHPQHRQIFKYKVSNYTRSGKEVIVPKFNTARYESTTVPSLAKLINQKLTHKI